MPELEDIAVFCGLDVGKGEHHATALSPAGKRLFDKALPNDEGRLRALFAKLAKHGTVLVVVDQPASIGALPVTVARDAGCLVAYLPGLTMRRIADLYPGEAKTDARDAHIIADAARTMPHTLRDLEPDDEIVAELHMLLGFDDDLAAEATRTTNRLRGLLHLDPPRPGARPGPAPAPPGRPCPARRLRLPGPDPRGRDRSDQHPAGQARTADGCPAGRRGVRRAGRPDGGRPGNDGRRDNRPEPGRIPDRRPGPAQSPRCQIEKLLEAHPLSKVLTSVPGIGVRTGARILVEIGDGTAFPTAAHLASYAGLAPVTRRSGSSIRGENVPRRGNRLLKRAFFLSAFASLSDPASRAYYDHKVSEGKRHNQALLCLARRRADMLFAMLKNGTLYEPGPARPS